MAHLNDSAFAWVPIWSETPRPKRLEDVWSTSLEAVLDDLDWSRFDLLLDYECGQGYDTYKIASRMHPKAKLVACDSNPYAQGSNKVKGVHHCLGDELLEPLPGGPYDFILWRFDATRPLLVSESEALKGSNLLGLGGILDTPLTGSNLILLDDCPTSTLRRLRSLSHHRSTLVLWIQSWRPMSVQPCSGALKNHLSDLLTLQQEFLPQIGRNWMSELSKAGFFIRSMRPVQLADQPGSGLYQLLEGSLLQQARRHLSEELANQVQQDLDYLKIDAAAAMFSPQSLILVASTEPDSAL